MSNQFNPEKFIKQPDTIRVLRVLEYTGPRDKVEDLLKLSIHGEKTYDSVTIKAATLGLYPEILDENKPKFFRILTNRGWLRTWGPRNDEGEITTFMCGPENTAFVFDNPDSANIIVAGLNARYGSTVKEVK